MSHELVLFRQIRRPEVTEVFRYHQERSARVNVPKGARRNAAAQHPIAFKLIVTEELIRSSLVREIRMRSFVFQYRGRGIGGHGRLHVNEIAFGTVAIVDLADSAMACAYTRVWMLTNRSDIDVDLSAKIYRTDADDIAQAPESERWITLGV